MLDAPPRRPRRWSRAVLLNAALLAIYAGAYIVVRTLDGLVRHQFGTTYSVGSEDGTIVYQTFRPLTEEWIAPPSSMLTIRRGRHYDVERTITMSIFAPCIAVEEWWFNGPGADEDGGQ